MLPPLIEAKIKRLVPLLASPHDGEVIATRNAIVRELASGRCDLHDLAGSIGRGPNPAPATPLRQRPASFGDLARAVRDLDRGRLSPKERAFVVDMVAKGFAYRPTPRQADWLDAILDRLRGRAAA